ncbi:unnamed protein product [marine sediment metagenome]|uniref:Uncharacterized protein n=1 Tax=marine sediment metagenome TaxID=412755 RepID=X1CQW4_9ZZZZ
MSQRLLIGKRTDEFNHGCFDAIYSSEDSNYKRIKVIYVDFIGRGCFIGSPLRVFIQDISMYTPFLCDLGFLFDRLVGFNMYFFYNGKEWMLPERFFKAICPIQREKNETAKGLGTRTA